MLHSKTKIYTSVTSGRSIYSLLYNTHYSGDAKFLKSRRGGISLKPTPFWSVGGKPHKDFSSPGSRKRKKKKSTIITISVGLFKFLQYQIYFCFPVSILGFQTWFPWVQQLWIFLTHYGLILLATSNGIWWYLAYMATLGQSFPWVMWWWRRML